MATKKKPQKRALSHASKKPVTKKTGTKFPEYDHKKIEKTTQKAWLSKNIYKTETTSKKKKYYVLDMFPYPSGAGLHVGHPRGYIASDVFARMKRMQGFNVLHPMGFDSFGLPAEQYAIQTGKNPNIFTEQLIKTYKKQLESIGFSYDWSREVATHRPEYYEWTQWIFLQIYNSWYDNTKNKARPIDDLIKIFEKSGNEKVHAVCDGNNPLFSAKEWKSFSEIEQQKILMNYRLAYEGYSEVNWCPELGTVLANDEIVDSPTGPVSERGGYPVEKKSMRQWFMRITAYADRLIQDLEGLDWSSHIKEIQKNWIGKSEGSEIEFRLQALDAKELEKDILIEFAKIEDSERMCEIVAHGWLQNNTSPETGFTKELLQKERGLVFPVPKEKIDSLKFKIQANPKNFFVAKKNNQIVGWLGFEIHEDKKISFGVYIDLSFTGKGIGTMLIKNLFVAYPESDYEIEVTKTNRAIELYKRFGFTIIEESKFFQKTVSDKNIYLPIFRMLRKREDNQITVFTTRADTLFGVTYVVLAPEHDLVQKLKLQIKNWNEVETYLSEVKAKPEEDRVSSKEKTGVEIKGIKAVNPANGEEVPVWIADYVLAGYGTGAVMAVPAHDERDFEFANKYGLPIKQVVTSEDSFRSIVVVPTLKDVNLFKKQLKEKAITFEFAVSAISKREHIQIHFKKELLIDFITLVQNQITGSNWVEILGSKNIVVQKDSVSESLLDDADAWFKKFSEWEPFVRGQKSLWDMLGKNPFLKEFICYQNDGILKNSAQFNGKLSVEARKKITEFVGGKLVTKYKIRDAIFARQRYWGEPIPLIHKKVEPKLEIKFSGEFRYKLLKDGVKTIEVRALDKKERKNVNVGDILKFTHIEKQESFLVQVKELWNFKNIPEIFKKGKHLFVDIYPDEEISTIEELYNRYKKVAPNYDKRIDKYGCVAWRVEKISEGPLIIPVSEKNLPLELPNVKSYAPSGTGESPLATVKAWTTAGYETNTMPGWAGSSWYFLRYMDPKNKKVFADKKALTYWKDVDMYVGGQEHATGHLLYARFWHKFLYDLGYVPTKEPFKALRNQGLIMATDGRKMSKRWGNVINPDDIVATYGADTLRVYEMFMGPFEASQPWSTESIIGSRRFVERVWRLGEKVATQATAKSSENIERSIHKAIKKVTEDIHSFGFNTAISAMMICVNDIENTLQKEGEALAVREYLMFIQILAPFAPHMSETLWKQFGQKGSIHTASWPTHNPKKLIDQEMTIVVQVNGKVRAELRFDTGMQKELIEAHAFRDEKILPWIEGKEIKRVIYVPGKLINIVC